MNIKHYLRSPIVRLSLSYLTIIMIMSIGFSCVFFLTSARELDKPAGPEYYSTVGVRDPDHEVDQWLRERAASGRASLAMNLALVNVITLILGSGVSYLLARRTLRPIEATMKIQERFIADASHELRTPLTSLLLTNEVALRKKRITDSDARAHIEQNVRDLQQLTKLSNELLDLASVSQPVTFTDVQVQDVIASSMAQVQPQADVRKITLTSSADPYIVKTHSEKLTKLLVILLDNAIKYSDDGGSVAIHCIVRDKDVQLQIVDQGIGMSKQAMEHIFERFYRADPSRTTANGHGLGLSIAVKLAGELQATLSATSRLHKGSTFTVSIPR